MLCNTVKPLFRDPLIRGHLSPGDTLSCGIFNMLMSYDKGTPPMWRHVTMALRCPLIRGFTVCGF